MVHSRPSIWSISNASASTTPFAFAFAFAYHICRPWNYSSSSTEYIAGFQRRGSAMPTPTPTPTLMAGGPFANNYWSQRRDTKMDIELRLARGCTSAEFSRRGGTPPESVFMKGVWRGGEGKGRYGEPGKLSSFTGSVQRQTPIVENDKAN